MLYRVQFLYQQCTNINYEQNYKINKPQQQRQRQVTL